MTLDTRREITETTFDQILMLSESKGAAYSGSIDTLANFKRNADVCGITPFQTWLVYAAKHWDTIINSIKQNPSYPIDKTEGLDGRINDLITYLILLKCLLVELDSKETVILGNNCVVSGSSSIRNLI